MKKILLVIMLTIASFQLAMADAGEVRAGFDTTTDYDMNDGSKEIGYGAKVEVMKDLGYFMEIGLGLGTQTFGEAIEYWGGNLENTMDTAVFSATPLYGVIKLKLGQDSSFMPYIRANGGYAMPGELQNSENFESLSNNSGGTENLKLTPSSGTYYGVGVGLVIQNFIVEVIYEVNQMDVEMEDLNTYEKRTYAESFSRVTLEIGFRVDLEGGFGSAVSFEPPN